MHIRLYPASEPSLFHFAFTAGVVALWPTLLMELSKSSTIKSLATFHPLAEVFPVVGLQYATVCLAVAHSWFPQDVQAPANPATAKGKSKSASPGALPAPYVDAMPRSVGPPGAVHRGSYFLFNVTKMKLFLPILQKKVPENGFFF